MGNTLREFTVGKLPKDLSYEELEARYYKLARNFRTLEEEYAYTYHMLTRAREHLEFLNGIISSKLAS